MINPPRLHSELIKSGSSSGQILPPTDVQGFKIQLLCIGKSKFLTFKLLNILPYQTSGKGIFAEELLFEQMLGQLIAYSDK